MVFISYFNKVSSLPEQLFLLFLACITRLPNSLVILWLSLVLQVTTSISLLDHWICLSGTLIKVRCTHLVPADSLSLSSLLMHPNYCFKVSLWCICVPTVDINMRCVLSITSPSMNSRLAGMRTRESLGKASVYMYHHLVSFLLHSIFL